MELGGHQFRWNEQFHWIPWNSMELEVRHICWHEQLYGIPSNLKCANFTAKSSSMEFHVYKKWANYADTRSSMEVHGTWSAPISLTQAVPWNSTEFEVCQFRWHEQFHGIPWNLECAYSPTRAVPLNSVEFHGTWNEPISLTRAVPWDSMEFHRTWCAPISLTWVIPWNLGCDNFDDTRSSMEFHGTRSALISMTRAVPWIPWKSMELEVRQWRWHEQFYGIPWNSMELEVHQFRCHEQFHGIPCNSVYIRMSQLRWHEKVYGIPWNLKCANFVDPSSSMEFHGIWNVPISLTREVPWNSIELEVRQFNWHEQFHGIPWNSMELKMRKLRWHERFHGIPWN